MGFSTSVNYLLHRCWETHWWASWLEKHSARVGMIVGFASVLNYVELSMNQRMYWVSIFAVASILQLGETRTFGLHILHLFTAWSWTGGFLSIWAALNSTKAKKQRDLYLKALKAFKCGGIVFWLKQMEAIHCKTSCYLNVQLFKSNQLKLA